MKVIIREEQYKRVILKEGWFDRKREIKSFQDYEDYMGGTDTNIIVYLQSSIALLRLLIG